MLKNLKFDIIRETLIKATHIDISSNFEIKSQFNKKENLLSVILYMNLKGKFEEITPLKIELAIEGIFFLEEKSITDECFEIYSNVKAPEMLFPFVLEIIHNLTLKAKVKPVIIPYIDFKKIYFEKKDFKTNTLH